MVALTRISKPSSTSLYNIARCLNFYSSAAASETNPYFQSHNFTRKDPKDRNVQCVFLGCPGVGKGTYVSRLSKFLYVPHIATGDLVREELASSGRLSPQLSEIVKQGKLVSDEIIFNLLSNRLEAGKADDESGFILDGFPRTVKQTGENGNRGINLAPLLPPDHGRLKLIIQADDNEEVVKEDFVYARKRGPWIGVVWLDVVSQPVEDFYRNRGKLLEFNLPGGIPESWPKLLEAPNLDEYEERQSAAA